MSVRVLEVHEGNDNQLYQIDPQANFFYTKNKSHWKLFKYFSTSRSFGFF